MQYNHPEVLYALFFLIIPVIVHLFQLRKFKRESFTNVKFLKRLTRQTRKSSRFKKWLILATRLLLLSCIIIAFAQPYLPSEENESGKTETYIYLDNSYSMQAAGQRGRLLNRSIQELLEKLPDDREFTLLTNDEEYPSVTRADLQEIDFSANKMDLETVFLTAQNRFSSNKDQDQNLLLISDFQQTFEISEDLSASGINIYAIPLRTENRNNISLDSVYLEGDNLDSRKLIVLLSYSGSDPGNTPVSIYSGENLLGKSSLVFTENDINRLEFPIEEEVIPEGRVEIEDNGLQFDNILYFTVNPIEPIKISSINAAEDRFLERIFRAPEFEYTPMPLKEINYNAIQEARVIILNEIEDLPPSLSGTFLEQSTEGTIFIVIPGEETGAGLHSFIKGLGLPTLGATTNGEKLITEISFEHPLFSEVFEEKINNFEYPKVQMSYRVNSGNSILGFSDNSPFLTENAGNFLFSAPLNSENSNFTQSPLIVPILYKMGTTALKPSQLYYLLGEPNSIEVPVELQQDRILEIKDPNFSFIPQQQSLSRKVEIFTEELPEQPGNYTVINESEPIMGLSYNVPGRESQMEYQDIAQVEDVQEINDVSEFFSTPGYNREKNSLWKWFVIFALLFLFTETLLLKYFK